MKAKNVTREQMEKALQVVNEKYADNIQWKDIKPNGKQIQFTLTVKDSSGPGARRSREGRKIAAACWHVHGDFFDALLEVTPTAIIATGQKTISQVNGETLGNWEDWNIGSQIFPFFYSEACEC